jgi:hypothetical protein
VQVGGPYIRPQRLRRPKATGSLLSTLMAGFACFLVIQQADQWDVKSWQTLISEAQMQRAGRAISLREVYRLVLKQVGQDDG